MSLYQNICKLVEYGISRGLAEEEDRAYLINRYLEIFGMDSPEEETKKEASGDAEMELSALLDALTDAAFEKNIIPDNGITQRDIFDTGLMAVMTDRPSNVIRRFRELREKNVQQATDWYYEFSCNTNYIRRDRVKKDRRWTVDSPYGVMDMSINLSKPEKDPKAIAAARTMKQTGYPKCQLCVENEGYKGRMDHPARQNHRIIPIKICGQDWGFQYSPYVYYNEHCIVLNSQHVPMKINRAAFEKLLSFVEQFPHYFLGSNADLPIVGGSILTHDHFQGGHYTFAMEKAAVEKEIRIAGYEDLTAGIVHWPLSVIRISSEKKERVIELADHILQCWRGYNDEAAFIFAKTGEEAHNTITPIARMRDGKYELDLTLRNNITTKEHPLGVYHPHEKYHHIKKENIGLIEVMGLAILPARLEKELELLEEVLVEGKPLDTYPELEKHKEWAEEIRAAYPDIRADNVREILEKEIGEVFVHVLEDAGVYKCTAEGREAFDRFIEIL